MLLRSLPLLLCLAIPFSTGCSSKEKNDKKTLKTHPTQGYKSPTAQRTLRNPDNHIPQRLSSSAGVSYSRVRTNQPYIALTFDDGPHPQNTPRLLDILRRYNVKATFYVVGTNAARYPNLIRRIVAEGHEIGNHTWSHPKLTGLSDAAVREQLNKTRNAIVAACGIAPKTLRPPYGSLSQRQRQWIRSEYGYPTILWSVDPLDWKRPGSSVVTSRIVQGTTRGGIVLAHDIHAGTIDAMPTTINKLLAKGFRFLTVSQLLNLAHTHTSPLPQVPPIPLQRPSTQAITTPSMGRTHLTAYPIPTSPYYRPYNRFLR